MTANENSEHMQNVKGIFASAVSGGSIATAWLADLQVILGCCVSAIGMVAGIYAALYWRLKARRLEVKPIVEEDETTL